MQQFYNADQPPRQSAPQAKHTPSMSNRSWRQAAGSATVGDNGPTVGDAARPIHSDIFLSTHACPQTCQAA